MQSTRIYTYSHTLPLYDALPISAPAWIAQGSAAPVDATWWASFGDPQLTALITAADAGSLDVRTARARLAEARADRDATAGARLPDRKSTRLNSSHYCASRMPSSA